MGILKRLIIVLAIIITGGTGAFGAEEISYWINPLYPHISDVSELTFSLRAKRDSVQINCYSYEDVKNAMKYRFGIRTTSFTLHMVYDFTWEDSSLILDQAFDEIREEDEYLSGNIIESGLQRSGYDGNVYATYSMSYLTTYTQEQSVDQRVSEILAEILTDDMNDEQKEKAIHDWVVAHVQYDTSYKEYSAYAALYLGRTVCQGYALLIYKMLQTVNIPARIVHSEEMSHAWNMVNLCGTWFHLDATWDDPLPDVSGRIFYTYYNRSDEEIFGKDNHYGWDRSAYPAAPESYTEGICGSSTELIWQTSKADAVALAKSRGKKILLLAGRAACSNTQYMKETVCRMSSPAIEPLLQAYFIPWYCDVDSSTEYWCYTTGFTSYTLPMICIIDPNDVNNYLDRTTSYQYPDNFYARLKAFANGDVDTRNGVELADAVLALQLVSGISPASGISVYADVNGDKRIGLEEAVYTLRKIAGLN